MGEFRVITLPCVTPTMQSGYISSWMVKVHDKFTASDVIATVGTDKIDVDLDANLCPFFTEGAKEAVIAELLMLALSEGGPDEIKIESPIAIAWISGKGGENFDPAMLEEFKKSILAEGVQDNQPSEPVPVNSVPTTQPAAQSAQPAAQPAQVPVGRLSPLRSSNQPKQQHAEQVITDELSGFELKQMPMRDALRDALAEEMRRDGDVLLIGEEVAEYQGAYKVSQGLLEEFGPKRVVDTPITEYGFTGIGVGAAFYGIRPVVEFMSFNFSMQAIDHVINSAAKTCYMSGGLIEVPIVFRGPNGAASGVAAQHSQCYAAWYAHVPGLKVVAPSTPADAKGLLKSAIRDNAPVVFLENELLYADKGDVPVSEDFLLPIGKSALRNIGNDLTIVTFSVCLGKVMLAVPELAKEGIGADVIDLRTLRPLDIEPVLTSVRKTNRCMVVEETWPFCGIGAEISSQVTENAFYWLDAPVKRLSGLDVPMPYAQNMEQFALPNVQDIIKAARVLAAKG